VSALPEGVAQPASQRFTLTLNIALWLIVIGTIGVMFPTLGALGKLWLDTTDYEHGFVLAAASLWLLFRVRERVAVAPVRPLPAVLPVLAIALLGWAIAYRANSEMLAQLSFPVVLLLAITASLGPVIARLAAFPVLFFYFAIPIWDQAVPLLQWMCTVTSEFVLGLIGVPTHVEGFSVTIPAGRFSIVEGCSGKRYLIIALAVSALAGYLENARGRRLLAIMAFAGVCALVVNWIRIIIIIYAGHISNMQHYLVAVEHLSLGYALYIPLLAAIIWFARRNGGESQHGVIVQAALASTPRLVPAVAATLGLLIVATLLVIVTRTHDETRVAISPPPLLTGDWQGPLPPALGWNPRYKGFDAEFRVSYRTGSQRIEIYANTYGVQSQDEELVNFENTLAPSPSWSIVRGADVEGPFKAFVASSQSDSRWLMAQTFVVGGRQVASAGAAQLLYGWSALRHPAPSGTIALAIPCKEDCESESRTLAAFWRANAASLTAMIPEKLR